MAGPIEQFLEENGGIWRNTHVVFTSGMHSDEYFDIRAVSHDSDWMHQIGRQLATRLAKYEPDIIIGPRTVGQTLVDYTAPWMPGIWAIWCEIMEKGEGVDTIRTPEFSPKTKYGRLVKNMRVAIIDDLVSTSSSFELTRDLVNQYGGNVVAAAVVVRRNSNVETIEGIPAFEWLEDIKAAPAITPEQCETTGMCFHRVPMVTEVGHGKNWLVDHPDYPVAALRD